VNKKYVQSDNNETATGALCLNCVHIYKQCNCKWLSIDSIKYCWIFICNALQLAPMQLLRARQTDELSIKMSIKARLLS